MRSATDFFRSNKSFLTQQISRWLLGGWLIAQGVIPLLGIGSAALSLLMSLVAIAAGVFILLGR